VICDTKVRINIEIPNKTSIYIKKLLVIIIEGKKEDVLKRLKQRFEYDGPFMERMLSVDPTGYKYVDYIAKQLEKIIPLLAGDRGGLNMSQQDAIQENLGSVIPWFHQNYEKINSEDIWRAKEVFDQKFSEDIDVENIAKSPRDINSYDNVRFLKELMKVVDDRKTEGEMEREAKSQSEKLYEDDEVLVVKPKSHAASCYYGANTRWCTATKDNSGYFQRYSVNGNLYYFINKKNNNKLALYVNDSERTKEVFNAQDRVVGIDTLKELFPNQTDLIDDLSGIGDFVKKLREYSRRKIDNSAMLNSDPSIKRIIPEAPFGQSELIIEFDNDDEFLSSLDLSDDDIWFLKVITSSYSDYEFMDSYSVEEDFKNGYIVYGELDEENMGKLKDIAEVVYPNFEFDLQSEDYRTNLAKNLNDLFPRQMDWILSDYLTEKNSEMYSVARETVSDEIDEVLEKSGIEVYRQYDEVKTTVANLLMWSLRLDIYKIDAKSLIKQIIEHNTSGRIGGWMENSYEFQNAEYFDKTSFNNTVSRQFDDILEFLESSAEEEGNTIGDFISFRNRIVNNFDLNVWYVLPKKKSDRFRIEGFDRDDMKVIVKLNQKETGDFKTLKLSEENFHNLLYQPELFD
jgi:hypothetical protein